MSRSAKKKTETIERAEGFTTEAAERAEVNQEFLCFLCYLCGEVPSVPSTASANYGLQQAYASRTRERGGEGWDALTDDADAAADTAAAGTLPRRHAAGAWPTSFLKARLNAASDS